MMKLPKITILSCLLATQLSMPSTPLRAHPMASVQHYIVENARVQGKLLVQPATIRTEFLKNCVRYLLEVYRRLKSNWPGIRDAIRDELVKLGLMQLAVCIADTGDVEGCLIGWLEKQEEQTPSPETGLKEK